MRTEKVESKVTPMLENLSEKPPVTNCSRIGQSERKPGAPPRPIRFKVNSSETVYQFLRKARLLRTLMAIRLSLYPQTGQSRSVSIDRNWLMN